MLLITLRKRRRTVRRRFSGAFSPGKRIEPAGGDRRKKTAGIFQGEGVLGAPTAGPESPRKRRPDASSVYNILVNGARANVICGGGSTPFPETKGEYFNLFYIKINTYILIRQ
jgi:hypothetical protein